MSGPIVLLGPQRPQPNLQHVLPRLGGVGPVLTVTAGWRHEEPEHEALHRAVGADAEALPLYQWFEEVMGEEPRIAEAWRQRQAKLVALKNLHRVRLHGALDALQMLLDRSDRLDAIARPQIEGQLSHLREIDQHFLDQSALICQEHPEVMRPWELPAVAARHAEAAEALGRARAVCIAGGHVAVLRNRLEFFGVHDLLARAHARGAAVVAWSAGAMALTERIVLFYDDPPDGPGHPELLDSGFELASDIVLFPHARRRLRLDDARRVSLLATRLGPALCVGLECGAWLERDAAGWFNRGEAQSALVLRADGAVVPLRGEGEEQP